jgi:hypothetical protein
MTEKLQISWRLNNLILGLFIFSVNSVTAQLHWSSQKIEYGILTKYTDKVVDVIIRNEGKQTDHLFRADFSSNFQVLYSTKDVQPGDSLIIRIKFNPRKTGRFKERVPIYFASSNAPYFLEISGDVTYVNLTEDTPCPDFKRQPVNCCGQFQLEVLVIDKITKQPIHNAQFELLDERNPLLIGKTDRKGEFQSDVPIGYYTLYAGKQGYIGSSFSTQVNPRNHLFVFELEKVELPPIPVDSLDTIEPTYMDSLFDFSEEKYAPNNIAFLVDRSGSMATKQKWPITEIAFKELSKSLRTIDQISMIALNEQMAYFKRTNPAGSTSGTKGFSKAFKILQSSFLSEGNNQLYVITDGAFKKQDEIQIEKLVKKAKRKKIFTTIVVIQGTEHAKENLKKLSEIGNGAFLCIDNQEQAHLLLEIIKTQSKKK